MSTVAHNNRSENSCCNVSVVRPPASGIYRLEWEHTCGRFLLWLGLCDCVDPLEELVILLILHILDFLDPRELGELGGVVWNDTEIIEIIGKIDSYLNSLHQPATAFLLLLFSCYILFGSHREKTWFCKGTDQPEHLLSLISTFVDCFLESVKTLSVLATFQ